MQIFGRTFVLNFASRMAKPNDQESSDSEFYQVDVVQPASDPSHLARQASFEYPQHLRASDRAKP